MSVKKEFQDMKQHFQVVQRIASDILWPKRGGYPPQDAPEEDKDTPRQQSRYASGRETPLEQSLRNFFQRMVGSTSSRDWTEICLKSQKCPWARIMVPWSN